MDKQKMHIIAFMCPVNGYVYITITLEFFKTCVFGMYTALSDAYIARWDQENHVLSIFHSSDQIHIKITMKTLTVVPSTQIGATNKEVNNADAIVMRGSNSSIREIIDCTIRHTITKQDNTVANKQSGSQSGEAGIGDP